MKIFQKIQMASEDVKSLLKTGVFYANGEVAATHDGALVHVGDPVEHDLYSSMKDLNARKIEAVKAVDDKLMGFVDYVGVNQTEVMGVTYRIGDKTAGVAPIAGERIRVRIPALHDEFWLGVDNFKSEPSVGDFVVPTVGDTVLSVGSETSDGLCLKVEDTKTLITGQVNDGKLYRCRVVSL